MFVQPRYHIRDCQSCGLLYRDRTLSAAQFERYYAQTDFTGWETSSYYPTERAVLAHLKKLPRGSRILDFGCSSGRLLAEFCDHYECFGFEINAEAAAKAASKGLQILSTHELDKESNFDAIVLVDVFEHLMQPLSLLTKLATKLNPRGSLFIVTGNGDAPACRRDPAQFWYFRIIEHVAMLTRRSAEHIAGKLALQIGTWQEMSHYDLTFREQAILRAQNFSYWQFHNKTVVAKLLQFIPLMRRLRRAKVAPTYTCSPDHALVIMSSAR